MPSGQWIFAGTALGFAILVTNALAQTNPDPAAIEALIPVPEPADVPPPSLRDIGPIPPPATSEQPAAQPPAAPAPQPLVTPAPASPAGGLAEIDRAVADSIKGMIERKLTTYFKNTREQDGARAFYTSREFAPLWIENGAINARATAAAAFLATVADNGLDSADYTTPSPRKGASTEDLADAELRFTNRVLEFARHAQTGRVHFSRVSADILYPIAYPDVVEVLTKLNQTQDVAVVLASYYPPHEGYRALRAKLACFGCCISLGLIEMGSHVFLSTSSLSSRGLRFPLTPHRYGQNCSTTRLEFHQGIIASQIWHVSGGILGKIE